MISKQVEVKNKIGFHARPASLLIDKAKQYQCGFLVKKGDKTADLRSIISLMKMQVKMGDIITITADGPDEEKAIQELVELIEAKFGEE